MPPVQAVFALNIEGLNLRRGLIGTGVVLTILVLAAAFGRSGVAAAVGAIVIIAGDFSGLRSDRLLALGGLIGAGAVLTAAIFGVGAERPIVSVAVVMLVTFLCSVVMAGVKPLAAAAGLLNIWLVTADGLARTPGAAVAPSVGFLIGGASALAVALLRKGDSEPSAPLGRNWAALGQHAIDPRHFTCRYALTRALALGLSTTAGWLLFQVNPFWPSIATLVIVQPDYGQALLKGTQRVIGTVIGVAAGILLAQTLALPPLLIAALVVVVFGYFTFMGTSYLVASSLLTLALLLLHRLAQADPLLVGAERIAATLLGIVVAVAAAALLATFRSREP
jgi:hypothetical protein